MTEFAGSFGPLLLLISIVGLVAAILLRSRDRTSGLLIALGFGVNILDSLLGFAYQIVREPLEKGADLHAGLVIDHSVSLVSRLISAVALALVFWGLYRLARRRPTPGAGPGAEAAR